MDQISHSSQLRNPKANDSSQDYIRVKNLLSTAAFTDGAQWPTSSPDKPKLQPIYVTLTISHPISVAAASDHLDHSINYSTLSSAITEITQSRSFFSSEDLVDEIHTRCFAQFPGVQEFTVSVSRPKGLLQPASTEITSTRTRNADFAVQALSILGMGCNPIVGINACEREQTQLVHFDLVIRRTTGSLNNEVPFPFRELHLKISNEVNRTQYLTLEALVSFVADIAIKFIGQNDSVTVRGGKPDALACAEAAEVEITRTPKGLQATRPHVSAISPSNIHTVAVALGSNLGDRFANIELALRLIEQPASHYSDNGHEPHVSIVDTSFMYETEPMYVTNQPRFINCTCLIETDIVPVSLLKFFKEIETTVGRVVSFRNGPRAIDLDILTYDSQVIDTRPEDDRSTLDNLSGQLVVPHPRIYEREFVLRPLNDMIPDYEHPVLGHSVHELFISLVASQPAGTPAMNKVTPFPLYPCTDSAPKTSSVPFVPKTLTHWSFPISSTASSSQRKSYLMATLNATPDSFSDGSINNTIPAAVEYATSSVAAGADIIDVGGYSTRPGAVYVSPEEEVVRVVPVIQAIREANDTSGALISVDTFRFDVAKAAVQAGANCINDVYAFTGPGYPVDVAGQEHLLKMRQVARDLAVPVILMHSRGEASANKDYSQYAYANDAAGRGSVLEGVRVELGQKVDAIVKGKGGLRRWFVIVDPGIGFSKTVEGNTELLRGCSEITKLTHLPGLPMNPLGGFPMLIGASRKSFLGAILAKPDPSGTYTGRETAPDERGWATAAAVACAVQQGAAVIRVHDVIAMGDVLRVASAIWS